MKCSSCGTELHHGHGTCVACGQPLSPLSRRFVVAEGRFAQLLARRQRGEVDPSSFQEAWKQIIVHDLDGGRWTPSTKLGEWHWYDGQRWVQRDPRDALAVERARGHEPKQALPWYKQRRVWAVAAIAGVIILAGICGGAFLIIRSLGLIDPAPRADTTATNVDDTSARGSDSTQVIQTGEATVADIGIDGGEVASQEQARVIIPGGAFASVSTVGIAPVSAGPPLPAEYGVSPAGPSFEVTLPEDTRLQGMVELLLPLERQTGFADDQYTVLRWDGASWFDVGGVVEGDSIRAQLRHFSLFQAATYGRPRRSVGFRNRGPYDATIMPWTFVPLGTSAPAPPPIVSTVSFAPGAPGGAPNPSRFLSLPLGSYTFCVEWTDKQDKDEDGYFDYYHYILDEPPGFPLILTEDVPESLDLVPELTVATDYDGRQVGTCPLAPIGQLGIQLLAGNGRGFTQPPSLLAFANTQNNSPPPAVTISSGGELWRYNEVIALMQGGDWIEATYSGADATAVGVQFLGDTNDGWARVFVDGMPIWVGSAYGTSPDWDNGAFVQYLEVSDLPAGPHTIRVEALGIPGDGGGDDVAIFFFGFSPSPVVR